MQVTCQFDFQGLPFIGMNAPFDGEILTVTEVKQMGAETCYRFVQYDRDNMKVYFNSIHFS